MDIRLYRVLRIIGYYSPSLEVVLSGERLARGFKQGFDYYDRASREARLTGYYDEDVALKMGFIHGRIELYQLEGK